MAAIAKTKTIKIKRTGFSFLAVSLVRVTLPQAWGLPQAPFYGFNSIERPWRH